MILEADRITPVKQRHTAKRIFERLRDEHGYAGGYAVVKDYVRIARASGRETFVPLAHPLHRGDGSRARYISLVAARFPWSDPLASLHAGSINPRRIDTELETVRKKGIGQGNVAASHLRRVKYATFRAHCSRSLQSPLLFA